MYRTDRLGELVPGFFLAYLSASSTARLSIYDSAAATALMSISGHRFLQLASPGFQAFSQRCHLPRIDGFKKA